MHAQTSSVVAIAAVAAALGTACGGGGASDTLPAGWEGAQALAVQQTACKSGAPPASPSLELTESGGVITGVLRDVQLRCEQQACAYVADSGATTRVLVQPCDLHPTSVPKCDCAYDVTFTLPAQADRTAVAVYERDDFYGASTPPQPALVASKPVGGAALRWYETCGDPVCFVGDGGAGSSDGGIAACTTEKAANPCSISGATCDPGSGCNVRLLCSDKDPRVQPGGCPISRRAAKRDISYLDDAALNDLAARLRDLRLARYRYKDAPRTERLGFVIDDGAGAIAVDEARDQIDLYSYLSWVVAALQVEAKRADALERELLQLRRELARQLPQGRPHRIGETPR